MTIATSCYFPSLQYTATGREGAGGGSLWASKVSYSRIIVDYRIAARRDGDSIRSTAFVAMSDGLRSIGTVCEGNSVIFTFVGMVGSERVSTNWR